MKITEDDINLLSGSASVEIINSQKDVESLYYIDEEMRLRGWFINVWDYDYMNHLCIELGYMTSGDVVNSRSEKERFIKDLVECINNVLNNK